MPISLRPSLKARKRIESTLNRIGSIALRGRARGTGYTFDAGAVRKQLYLLYNAASKGAKSKGEKENANNNR